jgi:hypothetical protein
MKIFFMETSLVLIYGIIFSAAWQAARSVSHLPKLMIQFQVITEPMLELDHLTMFLTICSSISFHLHQSTPLCKAIDRIRCILMVEPATELPKAGRLSGSPSVKGVQSVIFLQNGDYSAWWCRSWSARDAVIGRRRVSVRFAAGAESSSSLACPRRRLITLLPTLAHHSHPGLAALQHHCSSSWFRPINFLLFYYYFLQTCLFWLIGWWH